jgi:DNA adenine methylase
MTMLLADSPIVDHEALHSSNAVGFESPRAEPAQLLRWAGGKRRLLPQLLLHVPHSCCRYFEPFLGSGAMFFAIRGRIAGESHLTDLNGELLNFWAHIRDNPLGLHHRLSSYEGRNTSAEYYAIRDDDPSEPIERAARFFYLNQTAWNGLWRVNKHGVFNVPWGARPFRSVELAKALNASASLQRGTLSQQDFRSALAETRKGDFVYLDPPYLPVSDTSKFAGYTQQRFRREDLEELSDICEAMTRRGVVWMMSNRDTPLVRSLFAHATILRFTTRRMVAAQNKRNVEPIDSPEAIVTNRPLS